MSTAHHYIELGMSEIQWQYLRLKRRETLEKATINAYFEMRLTLQHQTDVFQNNKGHLVIPS